MVYCKRLSLGRSSPPVFPRGEDRTVRDRLSVRIPVDDRGKQALSEHKEAGLTLEIEPG
jgi:hypothetical protein